MCVTVSGLMELQWLDVDYRTLLHAIQLCKAFKARLWPDSKHVARQLEGIGKFVFIPPPPQHTHTQTHTHTHIHTYIHTLPLNVASKRCLL